MNIKVLAMASCLVLSGLSGCALTTDQIAIQYEPQPGVTQIPGASQVSVNVKVLDQRQDKSKVSVKKNGFGIEMAPIVATEDVALTIRRAIEQELQARGYQLVTDAALVQIEADLTRFYNDHKNGFLSGEAVAELNMAVTVRSKQGEIVYARQIAVQGVEPNTQIMAGENARLALNRSLQAGMKSLFDDQAFLSALIASSAPRPVAKSSD